MAVRHILKQKGPHVFSIGPDETVYAAIKLMATEDVKFRGCEVAGWPIWLVVYTLRTR
jgi:hypothetical protein